MRGLRARRAIRRCRTAGSTWRRWTRLTRMRRACTIFTGFGARIATSMGFRRLGERWLLRGSERVQRSERPPPTPLPPWGCGMWLHRQGFWEGPFGLWQAADKTALAGAFWRVTGGVTRGVRGWRHGFSKVRRQETGRQEAKLHEYADLLGVRHGISLLSETEKAAQGGLFLFLLYKFRISD